LAQHWLPPMHCPSQQPTSAHHDQLGGQHWPSWQVPLQQKPLQQIVSRKSQHSPLQDKPSQSEIGGVGVGFRIGGPAYPRRAASASRTMLPAPTTAPSPSIPLITLRRDAPLAIAWVTESNLRSSIVPQCLSKT
jgi:hypothetical protein